MDEGEDAVGEIWAGELVAEGLEEDGGAEVVVVGGGKDVEDGAGGGVVGGRVAEEELRRQGPGFVVNRSGRSRGDGCAGGKAFVHRSVVGDLAM